MGLWIRTMVGILFVVLAGCHDEGRGANDAAVVADDAIADAPVAVPDAETAGADATPPAPDATLPSGTIVLIASGGTSLFTGEWHGASWTTDGIADASNDAPAIALNSATKGLYAIRSTTGGELRAGHWAPGAFTAPTQISAGVTTSAAPALVDGGEGVTFLAFHGDDFRHYFGAYLDGWEPVAEPVKPAAGVQSFGPAPASIAAAAATPVIAFTGGDADLYDQERPGSQWNGAHGAGTTSVAAVRPAIVVPSSGPERLVVFSDGGGKIRYTARAGGVWSATADVDASAVTNDPVVLVALAGGDGLLAYRGLDGKPYWSRFSPGTTPAWSAPALVADVSVASCPALAPGVDGFDAELALVSDGAVQHTRLSGSTWGGPTLVGGTGQTFVAIASRAP